MANTLQEFLTTATQSTMADLEKALLQLPEDKRAWSPMGNARSALNQIAECAILNGGTADLIQARAFPANFSFEGLAHYQKELEKDWPTMQALLHDNTAKVIAAIGTVQDSDLGDVIEMPWAPMTLAHILAYPYWNMTYHIGQITYISTMLGE